MSTGPVCGPSEYQLDSAEASRHPEARDESVLRKVQWSNLCETGETGHHDPSSITSKHCTSALRAERVSLDEDNSPVFRNCCSELICQF